MLAGCSHGDDAVAKGGTFEFVSPGGKTDIFYDPPDHRGRPGPVSGAELMDPARTVSVDDFADCRAIPLPREFPRVGFQG